MQADRLDTDKTLGHVPKGLVNAFASIRGLFQIKYKSVEGVEGVPRRGVADLT